MVDTHDHETPNGQSGADEDDSPLFEWDDANVEHIDRHNIETWEAEEALCSPLRLPFGRRRVGSEARRSFIGPTDEGILLSSSWSRPAKADSAW